MDNKPIPKPASALSNAVFKALYSPLACFIKDYEDVIDPGICQADLPHLLDFAFRDKRMSVAERTLEDGSTELTPRFKLSPEKDGVEFIRLCPRPYFFNTGSHRAVLGVRYEGERYVMALEEAEGTFKENLFIGAYSEEGRRRVEGSYSYAVDIVKAALRMAAGVELFSPVHDFDVFLYDDPAKLADEGCTPSPLVYNF
jgi:hypothetical protein